MRYAIGIGVQKSATSWLHAVMATHPDIAASDPKELDFFSYYFDRGYQWYEGHFPQGETRFENSPSYFYDPRAPERIRRFAPEARIVVLLRDPVERAYSNHLHEVTKQHIEPCSFASGLGNNPAYLEQSRYAKHLSPWLAMFGNQVLCLISEEIFADPIAAANRVARHLDIAPVHHTALLDEPRNVSDIARFPLLRQMLRRGGWQLRKLGLEEQLAQFKQMPPARALLRLNAISVRDLVPAMTAPERAMMLDELKDDLCQLPGLLGRSSLPWASWQEVAQARGAA